MRARNKGVGVSEEEIAAAIAKGGTDKVTNYRLQQVIFVVPVNPTPAIVQAPPRRGQGPAQPLRRLRDRPAAGAIAAERRRQGADEPQFGRAQPRRCARCWPKPRRGMLTPPDRTTNGVEMVAVCDKDDAKDDSTLHEQVQKNLIAGKLVGGVGADVPGPAQDAPSSARTDPSRPAMGRRPTSASTA